MASANPKDNSTFAQKAALRSRVLMMIENPVVMETHGGAGRLYARCYSAVQSGVAFESDPIKAEVLGRQRPTWAVYEANSERALREGVGSHLEVNFLDLDPYGSPWETVDAFFDSKRPRANRLAVVVNDGLRQKLKMNGGWSVNALHSVVDRLGNSKLYERYLEICRDLMAEKAGRAGYTLRKWTGYYTGFAGQMSHYAAVLEL